MKYKEEISEREASNMLVGMKNVLLFLLLVFSLCPAQAVNKTETIYDTIIVKQTVIDTIHKFNSDSLTVALLKDSQTFYSNSFYLILAVISILLIILLGIWAYLNFKYIKDFENKLNEEFKKTNDKISVIEKDLKEQIENQKTKSKEEMQRDLEKMEKKIDDELENYGKKQKKDFDVMFRLISKRHFDLAIESIKDNNNDFWGYFSNMYLFCYCITGINLNYHDLSNLHIAYKAFEDRCKKDNNVISGNEPIFYRFVEYLLKLIKHCEDTNQNDYFTNIKPIYNKILTKFSDNTIIEGLEQEIKDSNYDPKDIQKILNLAKLYKD